MTAAAADVGVLNVNRIRTSSFPVDASLAVMMDPQRLKMAATSSAVVPLTKPDTSTTLPWEAELAPLMDSCSACIEPVASRRAFCAMELIFALGALG